MTNYDRTKYKFSIPSDYYRNRLSNPGMNSIIDGIGVKSMSEIPGVQYNSPPPEIEKIIESHVQPFMNSIPTGKIGGIFGITTIDNSGRKISNAVIAVKVNDKLEIGGYIAKTWGSSPIVYGVEAKFYF